MFVRACVMCVYMRACVRALSLGVGMCVRAYVCVCVSACVCVCRRECLCVCVRARACMQLSLRCSHEKVKYTALPCPVYVKHKEFNCFVFSCMRIP